MSISAARGFIAGIIIGCLIGAAAGTLITDNIWQRDAIERGLGTYRQGFFEWKAGTR